MNYLGLGLGMGMQRPAAGGGGGAALIPVSLASTYTFAGDTDAFILNAPLSLGQYVMGEPFFLSDAAVAFTQTGAPSVLVSSDMANGLEENFKLPNSPIGQGLDQMLGNSSAAAGATNAPYLPARNKDVTAAGANYSVAIGDEKTLVKAGRRAGATRAGWNIIDKYRLLTIIPTAKRPNVGDFRPAIASPDKTSWLNVSDINLSGCRSINVSALTTGTLFELPSYATTLANWRNPVTIWGTGATDILRAMQILAHFGGSSYSPEVAQLPWATGLHLHSSALTTAEKIALAKFVIQSGIDMTGEVEQGLTGNCGAGQHEAYWYILGMAYALTGHARFRAALLALNSNARQCNWTLTTGKSSLWPAGNEGGLFQNVGPRHTEYLGQALWNNLGAVTNTGENTNELDRTYLPVSGRGRSLTVPVLAAFAAWGSTLSGTEIFTNGGPQSDTSDPHGAMIHLVDLEMSTYPNDDSNYLSAECVASYNLMRPFNPVTKQTTFPPAIPHSFAVSAGAGSISWNATSLVTNNFGSVGTPITGVKIEVSQDGIQFETGSTTSSTSIAAVPGIPIWSRLSLQNANGWGVPSRTWPKYQPGTDTNKVTPTGTASGTVTNTVAPKLMAKKYPENRAPFFIPASGTISVGDPVYLGCGIWTGALTGTPTVIAEVELTPSSNVWTTGTGILSTEDGRIYYQSARDLSEAGLRVRVAATWMGVTAYSTPLTFSTVPSMPTFSRVDNNGVAYLERTKVFSGVADGKQGTFAFKGKFLGNDGAFKKLFRIGSNSSAATVLIERQSNNLLKITLKNPAGTAVGTLNSASVLNVATGEMVLMASWDNVADTKHMYRGNTSILSGTPTLTNDFIDYTQTVGAIAAMETFDAEVDYVYFDPTYVDLSVLANRDKFATAAAVGYYGQGPTGSIPAFFQTGTPAALNAGNGNRGYGGYFYLNNSANVFV